ncbi:MAG: ribonuclease Z [Planctomycetes bacterium]|nr:ribonuclease Z [Planctomycetota bacterium]
MKPSRERNTSAVFLARGAEGILFDCGEGTQRQFLHKDLRLTRVTQVLLSHWHGDHVLGLAGLIATLGASEYPGTLRIFGPKETAQRLALWSRAVPFDHAIQLDVREFGEGGVFQRGPDFTLEALPLKHRVPCLGYAFQEADRRRMNVEALTALGVPQGPLWGALQHGQAVEWAGRRITPEEATVPVRGRRVAYLTDTLLTENCYRLAADADLLICEAPHASDLRDKADEYMHLTARDAGRIAARSGAKRLLLQHFSVRYTDTRELVDDARREFANTTAAEDFMTVEV